MALLVALLACATRPSVDPAAATPPGETADSFAETGSPPVDCGEPCAETGTDAGLARCYACRCKEAMDGWLPGPEELQCGRGEPIVVYTADEAGTLTPVEEAVSTCANPTLLYGTCAPGGTLGQLQHGDVSVKWICRRNTWRRDHDDPSVPYDDVGAIFYNTRTGASCWFDDKDGTGLAGENWPDMDLTRADADVDGWLDFFYNTDGKSCVGCHDNDPYNYTPYLRSVTWQAGPWTAGPFLRVTKSGALKPTGARHLVSPEAAACTTCHRITSTQTCAAWAPDAIGAAKGAGYQDLVLAAAGDATNPLWHLGTWMPPEAGDDPAAWAAAYGTAAATVTTCCAHPGVDQPAEGDVPACVWEDLPG